MSIEKIQDLIVRLLDVKQKITEINNTIGNTDSQFVIDTLNSAKAILEAGYAKKKAQFNKEYRKYLIDQLNQNLNKLIEESDILLNDEINEFKELYHKAIVLEKEDVVKLYSKDLDDNAYYVKKCNDFNFRNKRYSYNEFRQLTSDYVKQYYPKISTSNVANKSKCFWVER